MRRAEERRLVRSRIRRPPRMTIYLEEMHSMKHELVDRHWSACANTTFNSTKSHLIHSRTKNCIVLNTV